MITSQIQSSSDVLRTRNAYLRLVRYVTWGWKRNEGLALALEDLAVFSLDASVWQLFKYHDCGGPARGWGWIESPALGRRSCIYLFEADSRSDQLIKFAIGVEGWEEVE